jgi:hypothetical protein
MQSEMPQIKIAFENPVGTMGINATSEVSIIIGMFIVTFECERHCRLFIDFSGIGRKRAPVYFFLHHWIRQRTWLWNLIEIWRARR